MSDEAHQVPYHLYRAIQGASLQAQDLIAPHGIEHIRQEVRRIFERNGMVFTRGRVRAAVRQSARNADG